MDEAQRERTLLHEVLHIVFAEIDQAVEHRIIELAPDDVQEHARALYVDALERTIERTMRAMIVQHNQEGVNGNTNI